MKLGNDPQSQLVLTPLERSVLRACAQGLGEVAPTLDAQAQSARVSIRTHSGVGFVTKLEIPEHAASLPPEAARRVRAVYASHPQLAEPAEFLIQLKDGRLASIEAYCPDGMWPADAAGFQVGITPAR